MKFYTGKHSFKGETPHHFTGENESESLSRCVSEHNEANRGKGQRKLRSLFSSIVAIPGFEAAKPIYVDLNKDDIAGAVSKAKALLSQSYESADEHFRNVQIACLVKKYPFPANDDVRRTNALKKFIRGERRNRHLNALLRRRRRESGAQSWYGIHKYQGLDTARGVEHMRRFIWRVIGSDAPLGDLVEFARWGPGAVVGVNGQFTNFARKLLAEVWTVTPAAIPIALTVCRRLPMFWELLGLTKVYHSGPDSQDSREVICMDMDEFDKRFTARLKVVQYNKVAFVPKDVDCDRTIASEPLINQILQLAIDGWMKMRLKKFGINLSAQSRNQVLAREGSILGWSNPYCTADLKNASGSIYVEIVRELFPPGWFRTLNSLRSPSYVIDKAEPVRYEGFASMGNGFCFPVETLIFASICSAAHKYTGTREDFAVYGDDIIVRQNESGVVQEYLRYFGFELNPDKSFFFGPFRESCGADWYDGEPVRPVYIDDSLDTFEESIRAHNAFIRLPNKWGKVLAESCQSWFPSFSKKFVRPFPGETDEAIDDRFGSYPDRHHMRCKTLNVPAWYGLSFRSINDREVAHWPQYNVAYKYGVYAGSDSRKPFAMRRETQMSVKRFYHGGGSSTEFPHEKGRCDNVLRMEGPPVNHSIVGFPSLKTRHLSRLAP